MYSVNYYINYQSISLFVKVTEAVKPEDQGMLNNLLSQLNLGGKKGQKGGMEMSLGNLCSCLFFTHDDPEEKTINEISQTLKLVDAKVTDLQKQKNNSMETHRKDLNNKSNHGEKNGLLKETRTHPEKLVDKAVTKPKVDLRKEEANPYWLDTFFTNDKDGRGNGPVEHLPSSEKLFWDGLIQVVMFIGCSRYYHVCHGNNTKSNLNFKKDINRHRPY